MRLQHSILPAFISVALLVQSCELFVIGEGGSKELIIEKSQTTSAGAVHLWKAELDSNNLTAVSELMRTPNGTPLLAEQRHELAYELARWRNRIGLKPITATTVDTLSPTSHTVHATIDYIKHVRFGTVRTDTSWYVTSVE